MLTKQRKNLILERMKKDGRVIAKSFSLEMNVSEDTIRRDLRELAHEGLLQRVHGGALPSSPALANFAGREQIRHEGKVAIGRAAARMIRANQVIILDGGTTSREIARHLPPDLVVTIVTHSPTTALELIHHPTAEIILIGGKIFKHSVVSVGAACLEAVSRLHADTFFMGVTGLHIETGLTTGDYEEAQIKRALSRAAADTYVLASAEKLNAASPYQVAALTEVTGIITENSVSEDLLKTYAKLGPTIIRA